MSMPVETGLRQRLAELISAATGGDVRADEALAGTSILNLGVDSLGMLRLVDAIEQEWGVEIEFDGPDRRVETVDDLVALVRAAATGGLTEAGAAPAGS